VRVGISCPQTGDLADPHAVREVALDAERSGYSSLWVHDRLLGPVAPRTPDRGARDGSPPDDRGTTLDPIGVLTLVAAVTERVRVGTSVLVAPWYPPVLLARSLATLDHVSAGRLTIGFGLGWSIDEYEAAGVPRTHLAARLEESLDVLDAVWDDDPVSFVGARLRVVPSYVRPKPVQRPRPPLLLAAYTPKGLARVARRADGGNPAGLPVDALRPMWNAVRDLAAGYDRDPDALELVVRANMVVTERPVGAERPSYCGTIDQIAEDLDATRETGADEVILGFSGGARNSVRTKPGPSRTAGRARREGAIGVDELMGMYDAVVTATGLPMPSVPRLSAVPSAVNAD
jgi:probable F420-dependent oxidoreductase